jgi:hypothetical protein
MESWIAWLSVREKAEMTNPIPVHNSYSTG